MTSTTADESVAPGQWVRWARWLVPFFVVALLAIALRTLEGELAHLRYHDVIAAVRQVPRGDIVLALVLTVASYLVLPGYDYLSLRYAGKPLPLRRIAFGSIITYGISQTLGLPAFTGATLRVRLWSSWGLSTDEIARAVAFASTTFSLGVLFLTGVAGIVEPASSLASLHLPVGIARVVAVLCLVVAAAWLASNVVARGKALNIFGATIAVPGPKMVVAQLAVATIDWIVAGSVLFVLLPEGHGVRFAAFLAAFVLAHVAGLLSHVPGGVGVFETLLLLQLGGTVPADQLFASLLVYRVIFYLIPCAVALLMLAVHEIRLQHALLARSASAVATSVERWTEPLLPAAMGAMTMIGGGFLLVSGATPAEHSRLAFLIGLLPLGIVEFSHFAGSVAGAALVVLGWALTRRLDAAWHLTRILLVIAIGAALLRGLEWEEAAALTLVLILLSLNRQGFYRQASLLAEPLTPAWIAAIVAIVGVSVWVGLFSYKHVEYTSDLWWHFAARAEAPRFLRASAGAAGVLVGLAVLRLLRHAAPRQALAPAETIARVATLLPTIPDSAAALALLGDKSIMMAEDGSGFLMYGTNGRSWIALGDPFGNEATQRELAWRFTETADEHGGWPVFYEVSSRHLPLYIDVGLTLLKVGEEAVVDLSVFSLEGSNRKGLRRSRRELEKAGAKFEVVDPSKVQELIPMLREVSDDWLESRATREKGFSLGRFDEQYLKHFPHALVRVDSRLVAFANLWTGNGQEMSVDLMRFRHDAPSGVMDYLFVELLLWGQTNGFRRMSLGMAPLSGLESGAISPWWYRLGGLLYRHGENFYNFQGLRRYKEKFDPEWEPRYLATPAGLALPRILTNVGTLISGGIKGLFTR